MDTSTNKDLDSQSQRYKLNLRVNWEQGSSKSVFVLTEKNLYKIIGYFFLIQKI